MKLEKKRFDESQVVNWFSMLVIALKHIHERKIIHWDLKPANIFLTDSNIIKLGDFGIAWTLEQTLEQAKTMVGTPYYIAPEIVKGHLYGYPADIWSLGIIMHEVC